MQIDKLDLTLKELQCFHNQKIKVKCYFYCNNSLLAIKSSFTEMRSGGLKILKTCTATDGNGKVRNMILSNKGL